MKRVSRSKRQFFKLYALVVFSTLAFGASAQGILQPAQTGVIQELNQLDGYVVISGVRYNFDLEVTQLQLQGEPFDDASLEIGMVVRFRVRNGMLELMEVLGPNNLIRDLDTH